MTAYNQPNFLEACGLSGWPDEYFVKRAIKNDIERRLVIHTPCNITFCDYHPYWCDYEERFAKDPLMVAIARGCVGIIDCLLEASPPLGQEDWFACLLTAVYRNHSHFVVLALKHLEEIGSPKWYLALFSTAFIAEDDDTEVLNLLLDHYKEPFLEFLKEYTDITLLFKHNKIFRSLLLMRNMKASPSGKTSLTVNLRNVIDLCKAQTIKYLFEVSHQYGIYIENVEETVMFCSSLHRCDKCEAGLICSEKDETTNCYQKYCMILCLTIHEFSESVYDAPVGGQHGEELYDFVDSLIMTSEIVSKIDCARVISLPCFSKTLRFLNERHPETAMSQISVLLESTDDKRLKTLVF